MILDESSENPIPQQPSPMRKPEDLRAIGGLFFEKTIADEFLNFGWKDIHQTASKTGPEV